MKRAVLSSFIVPALFLIAPLANAALVQSTVTGVVDLANTNPFGITTSTPVSAVAVYNDALLDPTMSGTIEIDANPDFSLDITIGPYTFSGLDDAAFGTGQPAVTFTNGDISGIAFADLTNLPTFAVGTGASLDRFLAVATSGELFSGSWTASSTLTIPMTGGRSLALPEPATLALFGACLVALGAGKRRRGG